MHSTTISNNIFSYLADIGVECVFLVPGGGNMFLIDAVGAEPRVGLGGGERGVARVGARDRAEQLGVVRGEALRVRE